MRTKRGISIKGKPKFAILVEGQTEFWYLQMLKRNERHIKVDIKPEIPQKKKLSDQYAKVIELSKDYDRVYWIVDLDVVLDESKVAKRGNKKAIDHFFEYDHLIKKRHKNIVVIVNQPCLEFWFFLHFDFSEQAFVNCEEAGRQLKKHLPDYEKTEKYFTKQGSDIYMRLKPGLKKAIENSKRLSGVDMQNINKGVSEMFKLFDDIGIN